MTTPPASEDTRSSRGAPANAPVREVPEQPNDQRYDKQHQKDEEQHFRDLCGAGGDAAEPEQGRDERYDKKDHGVMQHDRPFR